MDTMNNADFFDESSMSVREIVIAAANSQPGALVMARFPAVFTVEGAEVPLMSATAVRYFASTDRVCIDLTDEAPTTNAAGELEYEPNFAPIQTSFLVYELLRLPPTSKVFALDEATGIELPVTLVKTNVSDAGLLVLQVGE